MQSEMLLWKPSQILLHFKVSDVSKLEHDQEFTENLRLAQVQEGQGVNRE